MYKKISLTVLSSIFLLNSCGNTTTNPPPILEEVESIPYITSDSSELLFQIEAISMERQNFGKINTLASNVIMKVGLGNIEQHYLLYLELQKNPDNLKIEFNPATVENYTLQETGRIDANTVAILFEITLLNYPNSDTQTQDYWKLDELGYLSLTDEEGVVLKYDL